MSNQSITKIIAAVAVIVFVCTCSKQPPASTNQSDTGGSINTEAAFTDLSQTVSEQVIETMTELTKQDEDAVIASIEEQPNSIPEIVTPRTQIRTPVASAPIKTAELPKQGQNVVTLKQEPHAASLPITQSEKDNKPLTSQLSEPPEKAIMAYKNGIELYRIRLMDEAINMFSTAIQLYPNYHEALHDRGLIYYYTGDYDKALSDFNAAIRIKPNYADYLISRGGAYFGKRVYERAFTDFNAALRLEPDNAMALFHRGGFYFNAGDYDRAIKDFEAAYRIEPLPEIKELIEQARRQRGY